MDNTIICKHGTKVFYKQTNDNSQMRFKKLDCCNVTVHFTLEGNRRIHPYYIWDLLFGENKKISISDFDYASDKKFNSAQEEFDFLMKYIDNLIFEF